MKWSKCLLAQQSPGADPFADRLHVLGPHQHMPVHVAADRDQVEHAAGNVRHRISVLLQTLPGLEVALPRAHDLRNFARIAA